MGVPSEPDFKDVLAMRRYEPLPQCRSIVLLELESRWRANRINRGVGA